MSRNRYSWLDLILWFLALVLLIPLLARLAESIANAIRDANGLP
jgi:hypothetical protein